MRIATTLLTELSDYSILIDSNNKRSLNEKIIALCEIDFLIACDVRAEV